ncbi:MAG: hypothetical protein HY908_09065 [Myxococcales bacterium]|nr:hypothetical protein [Myxococcales bacterium]
MQIPGYIERDGFWVFAPTMLQYERLKSSPAPRKYSVLDQLRVDFSLPACAFLWIGAMGTAAIGAIQVLVRVNLVAGYVMAGMGLALFCYLSFNLSKIVRTVRIADVVRVAVPAIEETSAAMAVSRGVVIEGRPVTVELHLPPVRAIMKEGALEVEVEYVRGRSIADAISYRRALD